MWLTLEKNILRLRSRIQRFYFVNFFNTKSKEYIFENPYNDIVVDQSWNATSIRSDDTKSLKIAIVGLPNVGKSTLINELVGRPICAASVKIQTTRKNSSAIHNDGDTQLVFIDTPGLVTNRDMKKFKLDEKFKTDVNVALNKADIVGVMQDVSHPSKASVIDERIRCILKRLKHGVPSILILNKVDKIKRKHNLLKTVNILTSESGWPNFSDIFMVSALKSDGIDDLRKYLIDSAKLRDWEYGRDVMTDEPLERIIEGTVRAKFMDNLPQELPYVLKIETEHIDELADGSINTYVAVSSPSDRISKIIMGKGGGKIKIIALLAEQELCQVFKKTVRLKIAVKFSEQKCNNDSSLKTQLSK